MGADEYVNVCVHVKVNGTISLVKYIIEFINTPIPH